MVNVKARQKQRGLTLVEMMLYVVAVAAIIAAAFVFYNRQRNVEYMNNKPRLMQGLVSALEATRMTNGGAYPASATPIDLLLPSNPPPTGTAQLLAAALGTNNEEYRGWAYTCNNNLLTITVNVGDTPNRDLRVAVNRAIHNNLNNQGWDCNPAGYDGSAPTFNCTKPATCR